MGPSVNNLEKIFQLIDAGMNGARLNFSHGTHQAHGEVIAMLKKARENKQVPLAIILDTKGPEMRLGLIEGDCFEVKAGHRLLLVKESLLGNSKRVSITPPEVIDAIPMGSTILIDDGYIMSKVVGKTKEALEIEFINDGTIKNSKGINIPGVNVPLPAMTKRDIEDIRFGCEQDVDIIAASFIRSAEHILQIKELLVELGKPEILVYAKIENSLGVDNFDEILEVADGILVARGDLGVELPLPEVPSLQKMMTEKSHQFGRTVVIATQMLESMIQNPRPTRAEVSDVANAIFDSSSCIMLSGETAVGKYPIETVAMMKDIAQTTEKDFDYRHFFSENTLEDFYDVPSSLALASVRTAYSASAKAIFAVTSTGSTARLLARFRPSMPIIAFTENTKTFHQLALEWGVTPVTPCKIKNVQEAFEWMSNFATRKGLLEKGDLVVITSGTPFGIKGTTNNMTVECIGDILVRGEKGYGEKVHGRVAVLFSSDKTHPDKLAEHIVLLTKCEDAFALLLKKALGIVLQNKPGDRASEESAKRIAKSLNIPLILRADGAIHVLKEGQLVTLDPKRGIIYRGEGLA